MRQGSLYKHFRHIRPTIGCYKVPWVHSNRHVLLLSCHFTCHRLPYTEGQLVQPCLGLPESHSAERKAAPRLSADPQLHLRLQLHPARVAGLAITLLPRPDVVSLFAVTNYSPLGLCRSFLDCHIHPRAYQTPRPPAEEHC